MEIVLNDFSVTGQFASLDEFVDYVLGVLSPVLDCLIERKVPFFKKQDFYSSRITEDLTLNDILLNTGDPALSVIRQYIISLAYQQPYWDDDMQSRTDVSYDYPAQGQEPNCFTEVIERKGAMFSFPSDVFQEEKFLCRRQEQVVSVKNITEKKSFLCAYLKDDIGNIRYILETYPYARKVTLATIAGKCYAEEALLDNDLTVDDLQNIILTIPRMLEGMGKGEKNDYWDSFRDGIFEYRVHVSGSRIFRLFFFQEGGVIFLNGFIKKTQTTPPEEIAKAIKIKKSMGNR